MSYEKSVSDQYGHGNLINAIKAALPDLGKTPDTITIQDLAPIDEFHVGGRKATDHLINQLNFSSGQNVLDVGCGLGGAARYVADKYDVKVTGIDLTEEYIETGNTLCRWVKLDKRITLQQGSALSMPFQDNSFDNGFMLHVGMNIFDKALLFSQIYRVLKPGASFGIYDVMRYNCKELSYPVPWASDKSTCKISTPLEYTNALNKSGFEILSEVKRRDFALSFFKKIRETVKITGGLPPLGLHTLMQKSASVKTRNMVDNIAKDYIAPVEMVIRKKA